MNFAARNTSRKVHRHKKNDYLRTFSINVVKICFVSFAEEKQFKWNPANRLLAAIHTHTLAFYNIYIVEYP